MMTNILDGLIQKRYQSLSFHVLLYVAFHVMFIGVFDNYISYPIIPLINHITTITTDYLLFTAHCWYLSVSYQALLGIKSFALSWLAHSVIVFGNSKSKHLGYDRDSHWGNAVLVLWGQHDIYVHYGVSTDLTFLFQQKSHAPFLQRLMTSKVPTKST